MNHTKNQIKVGSKVILKKDFYHGREIPLLEDDYHRGVPSKGIDVPEGTVGIVKEINEGGPEEVWLHVCWEVGDARGTTPRNVYPSEVTVVNL